MANKDDENIFNDILSPTEENTPIIGEDDLNDLNSETEVDLLYPANNVLAGVRSMENILLDTSAMDESIDLGNSMALGEDVLTNDESDQDIPESIPYDAPDDGDANEEKSNDGLNAVNSEQFKTSDENIIKENISSKNITSENITGDETRMQENTISKYFQASEGGDIFDSLVGTTESAQNLSIENAQSKDEIPEITEKKVRVHLESHSSISDEVTAVDFEEDKGNIPLKPTPSTRSLCKYFNADGTEVCEDSRSFFDAFTVGENEDPLSLSCPSSGFPSLEPNAENNSIPETPPIPIGSPMPSPFHQTSAPPSATGHQPFFGEKIEKKAIPSVSSIDISLQPTPFPDAEQSDPFTFGLNISDLDRRHDAWIPTEVTRQVLVSIMTSVSPVTLQPEQMTMPGVIHDEPLGDPVKDLVHRYIGEVECQKRIFPGSESVAQDETGLRQLLKAECFRSAVDLTGKLLAHCGQGLGKVNTPTKHTPYTLQLWFCRISLLVRLRLHAQADAECKAFNNLDKPDLYYEFYQDKYSGRRGSMVPFGLRLIHAEIPHYLGKIQESLDRIYYLHAIVKKILSNLAAGLAEDGSMINMSDANRRASRELWESREIKLLYSVANCLLTIKDYNTTLAILEDLLKKDVQNKTLLLCSIARIYLQMGDTVSATNYINKSDVSMKEDTIKNKCQKFMNRGFLSLGQNQFKEAYDNFKTAVSLDRTNAVALNNMAVCALYTGNLSDALETLEKLVHENPEVYLQEGILFNLCTLYELESSNAIFKKQKLLSLVSQHKGNGFNVACLKMI